MSGFTTKKCYKKNIHAYNHVCTRAYTQPRRRVLCIGICSKHPAILIFNFFFFLVSFIYIYIYIYIYPNLALYIYCYEIIVLYLLYLICFCPHKFMNSAFGLALSMKRVLYKFGIIIIIKIINKRCNFVIKYFLKNKWKIRIFFTKQIALTRKQLHVWNKTALIGYIFRLLTFKMYPKSCCS